MAAASLLGVWVDGPLDPSVPANTAVQLDWPRGQDGDVELRLVDQDGQRVDLDVIGADRLALSVRSTLGGDVLKAWLAAKSAAEVGLYSFSIASADTIDFSGRYILDVWATRGGVQRQVVAPSYFNAGIRVRAS